MRIMMLQALGPASGGRAAAKMAPAHNRWCMHRSRLLARYFCNRYCYTQCLLVHPARACHMHAMQVGRHLRGRMTAS